MRTEIKNLHLPEGVFSATVDLFDDNDCKDLCKIYDIWRELCEKAESFKARKINLPDCLSECSFCYFFNCWRTNSGIPGAIHSSFDAYDPQSHRRIQIKGTSVASDLTSFGPNSVWDDLYFVDFYKNGNWDYTFDVYLIPNDKIYNMVVNKDKCETFLDQQKQGRRPRFSITKDIIEHYGIRPKYTCNIKTGTLTENY